MTARYVLMVAFSTLLPVTAAAQPPRQLPATDQYIDPINGISLDEAIARALHQEPSLRAARSEIEVARGTRTQASLRPNPMLSFEQLEEPGGTDHRTTVALEWPLDLFRRNARMAVADHEINAVQLSVAERERRLAGEVRMQYGEVLAAVRDFSILDQLVAATQRQHELLRSRVAEGAAPPLERDLVDVDLRRLESDRLLQAGRTAVALFQLKRLLGLDPETPLRVRETLEDRVRRDSSGPMPKADRAVLDARSDVRGAAARVEIAAAGIEQAEAEGRFDLTLFANYMNMDAGFPQQGLAPAGGLERVRGQFHYISAGATITIPVLNRHQGAVAAARATHLGAASALEAVRLSANAELSAARVRDDLARQAVNAYTDGAQTLARRNLTVVSQSYDLGRVSVFDVLAEQRRYLDVERAYTEALRSAYEARTALNLALGGV